ncbi:MAG TPA: ornithine cyclodeaminase family protein [Thermoplasmata archaeon]|nr:ornithine cyclodeaminase family protein [Thermoplasmata archaeon]
MLYLTEEEVDRLLPMDDAIREVERALGDLGEGRAENRPRQRVRGPHAVLNLMAASWPGRGYYGYKDYSISREGVRFWFHLFDGNTGALLAVLQANRMGQRRTGAASGVATKYLARKDAAVVGLVGTGWQAESQLEAICAVRPVTSVRCTSRDTTRRQSFAARLGKALGVDVVAVDSGERAVRRSDIVVAATSSSSPVVLGAWLEPGMHVNAMGANRIDSRELDDEAIRRFTLIAADSADQARHEAGDLVQPVRDGILSWDRVHEIAAIVSGGVAGRESAEDLTLFKSLGIAIEDVAVAALVYERAREQGVGKETVL